MSISASSLAFRLLIFVFVVTGCLSCGSHSVRNPSSLVFVESFEGATLYRTTGTGGTGTYSVLSLAGDWRQMGRQYGYLERNRLRMIYENYLAYLTARGLTYERIRDESAAYFNTRMEYVKTLINGMSETSGMSLDQHQICAVGFSWIIETRGCSSMDAWGEYTGGGPLVAGRNWDLSATSMEPFNRFLTVVVYNPTGSSIPAADINYLGAFLFQSGMNKSGIFLNLQNGAMSDHGPPPPNVEHSNDLLLTFLLDCPTLDALDAKFLHYRSSGGTVMNAADENRGRVYEWATTGTKIRNGNGLLASSNHFVDPAWHLPLPPDGARGGFTKERLANLLSSGEAYRGRMDVATMQEIFGRTIDQGGPSFLR